MKESRAAEHPSVRARIGIARPTKIFYRCISRVHLSVDHGRVGTGRLLLKFSYERYSVGGARGRDDVCASSA